ncbi:hypothetical protein Pcinc_040139 [Petrolisthes cinctipes]|uniref:Uncharacterized protein n=1 Tax=Petrolisthes cinctipes TaxID=88211 RepID=A0AAE1BPS0_PETCI|nr:hypothetical protein Pcinc_040139 [Petrolisthes cinctipes]
MGCVGDDSIYGDALTLLQPPTPTPLPTPTPTPTPPTHTHTSYPHPHLLPTPTPTSPTHTYTSYPHLHLLPTPTPPTHTHTSYPHPHLLPTPPLLPHPHLQPTPPPPTHTHTHTKSEMVKSFDLVLRKEKMLVSQGRRGEGDLLFEGETVTREKKKYEVSQCVEGGKEGWKDNDEPTPSRKSFEL